MRHIDEIIIHCAATKPNWMVNKSLGAKVAAIRSWHVNDNGWADIGYHYIIDRDGSIMAGRPVERSGAHTRGHNKGSIGVCLIGGHGSSADDEFEDNFTIAQDKALRSFVKDLRGKYPSISKVSGHNQYAAKACPGFNVMLWMKEGAMPSKVKKQTGGLAAFIAAIMSLFGKD